MKLTGCFSLLVVIILTLLNSARAADEVRVRLFSTTPDISTVNLQGPVQITQPIALTLPEGNYWIQPARPGWVLKQQPGQLNRHLPGGLLVIKSPNATGLSLDIPGMYPRRYDGWITVQKQRDGKLEIINRVSKQDYVMSVVSSETPPKWPLEALKAQAVLTQTRLARYPPNAVLTDSTQDEAYHGKGVIRPEVTEAVRAVWGQTLTVNGRPVTAYYHAACGGQTSPESYFSGGVKPAKHRSVVCPYCKKSPFWLEKVVTIPRQQFEQIMGSVSWQLLAEDTAQRTLQIRLSNGKVLSGYQIWLRLGQKLGWDKVPGTRFRLVKSDADKIQLASNGAGHGVGLCQWGAAQQAKEGQHYPEILKYYFPDAVVHAIQK